MLSIAAFLPGRLSLSHNGIDTVRFSSDGKRRNEARSLLGVSSDQVVFLLLGYSPLVKGVDVFIKAADELQRRRHAVPRFSLSPETTLEGLLLNFQKLIVWDPPFESLILFKTSGFCSML